MNLSKEEMQALMVLLQVAYEDATVLQKQSHDLEEVKAYKEHKSDLFKWIIRLQQEVTG